jgi:hypothetical protein
MPISKIKGSAINDGAITLAKTDSLFVNTEISGTEAARMPQGTTAQRANAQSGDQRFNSTLNLMEYYDGTQWKPIDSPPTISSLDVTEVDSQAGGNQTIVITGSKFSTGAVVTFVGNSGTDFNASSTTFDSTTQLTVVAPKSSFLNAQEPYGVKVTSASGLTGILSSQINVDTSPTWSTSAGNIANILENATGTHATIAAADADGDTIAYSETTSVLSGAGLSLNSSTGAITGDPTDSSTSTTYNFTARATASGKTADRAFNIVVASTPDGGNLLATYTYNGTDYKIHKFTSNGNFAIHESSKAVDYLIIGGGGGSGHHSGGGGGAGGLVWQTAQTLSAGTYAVVVGAGGVSGNNDQGGQVGANSTFNSKTGLGGGGGGSGGSGVAGDNGGSGGGGARGSTAAGSSTQNSTYGYGVGYNGRIGGANDGSPNYAGYAGGGAGGAGAIRIGGVGSSAFVGDTASTTAFLLASVAGTNSSNVATTGSSSGTLYIGGGGGGSDQSGCTDSLLAGGLGGGAAGSDSNGYNGTTAIANTGGGAGGQGHNGGTIQNTANGATGIVIVRYAV